MVNQLATEYADQPVVFLEYDDDDNTFSSRKRRWWSTYGGGSVLLPLVMVDSGNYASSGYEDFDTKYRSMVDTSLAREPQAEISAVGQRVGDTLHFDVEVTNRSDVTLSSANSAAVWVIVYEEFASPGGKRLTNRYVQAIDSNSISTALPPDGVQSFTLDATTLDGVVWDNLRAVVLVDYLPSGSSGAYDMLQAVSVTSFP